MVSAKDVGGMCVAFGKSFVDCVPLGLIIITLGIMGFVSVLEYDYVLTGAVGGGIVLGILGAGFTDEETPNRYERGASAGGSIGLTFAGLYFMWAILTGAVGVAIDNMSLTIGALVIGALAVVVILWTIATYILGGFVKNGHSS